MQDAHIIKKLQSYNYISSLVLALLGVVFVSAGFSLGVLVGGGIAVCNFHILQRALQQVFDPGLAFGRKAAYYLKYYVRLIVVAAVLYMLIKQGIVHPLGLISGLSVVVANIMIIAFTELWRIFRTKEAT